MLPKAYHIYTVEELNEGLRKVFKDDEEGKLPTFTNAEEVFKHLGI